MVAIQGASGASPDGLPRASGDEEVNPEGVLPSGQTVSFTAVEKNESAAEVPVPAWNSLCISERKSFRG